MYGANVQRCPSIGYGDSYIETYGIRTTYHDATYEPRIRFVRIAGIHGHSSLIWLADASASDTGATQTNNFGAGFNWPTNLNETELRCVHTRHMGNANAWFLDGRVESCGPDALREYAGRSIYYRERGGTRIHMP